MPDNIEFNVAVKAELHCVTAFAASYRVLFNVDNVPFVTFIIAHEITTVEQAKDALVGIVCEATDMTNIVLKQKGIVLSIDNIR